MPARRRRSFGGGVLRALDLVRCEITAEAERCRLWAPVAFGLGVCAYLG